MSIDNENARRNYALVVNTFDAEHLLQIACGGEVLVTVTQPAGPTIPEYFLVFNGEGIDEDDNDLDMSDAVKRFPVDEDDIQSAWREAAKFGYNHALAKMMCADQKADRLVFA